MTFFDCIGVNASDRKELRVLARELSISIKQLDFYQLNHLIPFEEDMNRIEEVLNISELALKIRMGVVDSEILNLLRANEDTLTKCAHVKNGESLPTRNYKPFLSTELGTLYQGDCIEFLKQKKSGSYDLIFADPPFNLDKFYLSKYDDNVSSENYLSWCFEWLDQCIRVLKDGGSLLIWNLPKWNSFISNYLNNKLLFRHWIATDIKFSLPISGKLYPSHYSLIYYSKGKPKTFVPDRLPMEVCRKCLSDLKDYGGYKNKMNPKGINLTDVWYDIPPVRHAKYKRRKEANELSIKLMDRIIEMTTMPNDIIFDPFGGSGTTYITAEMKNRRWEGIELGPLDDIISRFENIEEDRKLLNKYRKNYNNLFPPKIKAKRMQMNLWTDESFLTKEPHSAIDK